MLIKQLLLKWSQIKKPSEQGERRDGGFFSYIKHFLQLMKPQACYIIWSSGSISTSK